MDKKIINYMSKYYANNIINTIEYLLPSISKEKLFIIKDILFKITYDNFLKKEIYIKLANIEKNILYGLKNENIDLVIQKLKSIIKDITFDTNTHEYLNETIIILDNLKIENFDLHINFKNILLSNSITMIILYFLKKSYEDQKEYFESKRKIYSNKMSSKKKLVYLLRIRKYLILILIERFFPFILGFYFNQLKCKIILDPETFDDLIFFFKNRKDLDKTIPFFNKYSNNLEKLIEIKSGLYPVEQLEKIKDSQNEDIEKILNNSKIINLINKKQLSLPEEITKEMYENKIDTISLKSLFGDFSDIIITEYKKRFGKDLDEKNLLYHILQKIDALNGNKIDEPISFSKNEDENKILEDNSFGFTLGDIHFIKMLETLHTLQRIFSNNPNPLKQENINTSDSNITVNIYKELNALEVNGNTIEIN